MSGLEVNFCISFGEEMLIQVYDLLSVILRTENLEKPKYFVEKSNYLQVKQYNNI